MLLVVQRVEISYTSHGTNAFISILLIRALSGSRRKKIIVRKKTFSALRAGCNVIQRTIGQKADFSFKLHSEAEKRNQFSFVCISLNT